MEERQGTESSWIPETPLKRTRAAQKLIYKERQSNPHCLIAESNSQTSQLHLGNSNCIQKEIQAQNAGDSSIQKDYVACNPSGITNDSGFYLDLWNRGMANLINYNPATTAQTAAQSSSCGSASINHVKCVSSGAESSDSSSTFKGLFPESVRQCASETYQRKGAELNASIMYNTAPSTPNLNNTVDKDKGSDEQNYQVVDAEAKESKDSALDKIPIESSGELQEEGQPELVVDISCSNVSKMIVEENHEPDTGSCQNIDVKTPQQRPRKKKHRPKVVIDGMPKRKPRNARPASSEKINTPKRKYVRRKNVGTEAETPKEGITQNDLGSEVKTTPKRKYNRVKKVNEPTMTPPEELVSGTSIPKYNQVTKRPCRRSLNFGSDSQIACEKSSSRQMPLTKNQMTSTALKPEEKVGINIGQYNLQSTGKEFEDYLLSKGVKTDDFLPPTEYQQLYNKSMVGNANDYYNKVANFLNSRTQKEMGATNRQYTSNYSSILTQETYGSAKKREWPSSAGPSDSYYRIYSSQPQANYIQDFSEVPQHRQEISFQHFPEETFMKKKIKQAHNSTDYTMMSAIASADRHMQNYATAIVNNCREACGFGTMKVNRSANSGPSRISKVHSSKLMPMRNAGQITMEQSSGLRHSDLLSCFTPRTKLQCIPSVDDVIKQFKRLNISTKRNARTSRRKKALISDPYRYSGNNALVVYQRDQSMIPYVGSSNRSKRRGPRPKVDLDEETARVWTLLLENIDSPGIDGTDEEKRRYWEEEREVFGGRVESFVAKMRLLQGDRRFRPWKGSVVDSVIGVFLTQNVSDHLSSSAFMSMASKFPLEPKSDNASSSEGISEIHNLFHLEGISGDVFGLKNYQELVRNLSEGTESTVSSECGQTVTFDCDLRASDNILSSQTSVVSPQNSTDSILNKKELSSHVFLEEESTSVCFQNTSSFVELLQMQEQRVHDSPLERDADQSGLSEESGAGPSSQNSIGICSEQTVQNHTILESKHVKLDAYNYKTSLETTNGVDLVKPKSKNGKIVKEPEPEVDWDSFRIQAEAKGKRERSSDTMDSVNWEQVRCTEVRDIAEVIKERGMNNRLAGRIKDFLNRLIRDHGSLDLEWIRDIPPDKAKEYLLSVKGLGLKSVECVRLLTLHHLAFPVDTNVGRIAVRLGWVPLQPLPESLQLHLLELYPVLESIQKHLWPRLCKLDQRELYELHYHMITFGKVFCTKSKPNCNACPMRAECRHFASAYASARLALPAPVDKSIVNTPALEQRTAHGNYAEKVDLLRLPRPESTENLGPVSLLQFSLPTYQVSETSKPIIEEPKTPEPEPIVEEPQISDSEADTEKVTVTEPLWTQSTVDMEKETVMEPQWMQSTADMEDIYKENDDEIPTIDLNLEALNQNLQSIMREVGLQDSEYSKALVVLTPAAAAIPMPKLKNINRLRTEHQVYLLPDSHQLLKGLEKREENDPSPYLLAIWAPGETINSIQPPERKCSSEGSGQLCYDDTCFSCNSIREATSHTVRGTILIPCRTAMRGSFPLNGTYFQVNEVFADHETSLNPIDIPRDWLWNLRRRTVYFGTSIPSIFKGLGDLEIQYCFWKGFVCVRGFDRETRGPRPLIARLHFPVSRMPKINKEGGGGGGGGGGGAGTGLGKDETPMSKQVAS